MAYKTTTVPAGERISISNGKLNVPNHPIVPFIRGDGTGPDIWAASEVAARRRRREGVRRETQDRVDGGLRRRVVVQQIQ